MEGSELAVPLLHGPHDVVCRELNVVHLHPSAAIKDTRSYDDSSVVLVHALFVARNVHANRNVLNQLPVLHLS